MRKAILTESSTFPKDKLSDRELFTETSDLEKAGLLGAKADVEEATARRARAEVVNCIVNILRIELGISRIYEGLEERENANEI